MAMRKKAARTAGMNVVDLHAYRDDNCQLIRVGYVVSDRDESAVVADMEAQYSEALGQPVKVVIGKFVTTDDWLKGGMTIPHTPKK